MKRIDLICDVDGVILDFARKLIPWIYKKTGIKLTTKTEASDLNMKELLGDKKRELITEFINSPESGKLDLLLSDMKYFNKLSTYFYIYIYTDYGASDEHFARRLANLDKFKLDYNVYRGFNGDKMETILRQHFNYVTEIKDGKPITAQVPAIVIEDQPRLAKELADAGSDVYFPSLRRYTKGMEAFATPFRSWKELLHMLTTKYKGKMR